MRHRRPSIVISPLIKALSRHRGFFSFHAVKARVMGSHDGPSDQRSVQAISSETDHGGLLISAQGPRQYVEGV